MNTRRQFIKKSSIVTAGCCCFGATQLLSSCTSTIYLTPKEYGNLLLIDRKELTNQKFVVVNSAKTPSPIYLKKISENEFKAFSMHCTHKGCTVKPAGSIMVCPCHGAEFSNEGKVLSGPARDNLKEYSVSINGKIIEIKIG